jgi:transcriptional regulator with XRE-family HTH domain
MNEILNELDSMFDEAIEEADKQSLGQKLQGKRLALNLKLVDVANATGLSESLIGKMESDQVNDIKVSTMKKLSMAYEIPADVFIAHLGLDESLAEIEQKIADVSKARNVLKR